MNLELINTGSELMLGRVLNTHQQWLCRQLSDCGYTVCRQVAVADTPADIQQAVQEALARSDVVFTTGGLGPTSDDLTREVVAALVHRPLREDPTLVAHIEQWFTQRHRPLPPSTRVQALVPEGATVWPNAHGTAPGLLIPVDPNRFSATGQPAWLAMLPGPPRELHPMFRDQALPWLLTAWPVGEPYVCHTLRTTGIGESMLQERIAGPLADAVAMGLETGYCARVGEVDVRLSARGAKAAALVAAGLQRVRELIGAHVFGGEDEDLESVVVRELKGRGRRLVVAESCTGGRLASRITDVPGASAVFLGGAVSYSNELKLSLLGVRAETLAAYGAVSEATAREMAEGARVRYGADYALATTGIAGPAGGTDTKPVGTVFIALASATSTTVLQLLNRYDRATFKNVTTQQALELLRRELLLR